jgi:phosphatidylserine/phosphatidylglycerophosphate/cardiolipin synthase-like enzyme
MQRINFSRNNKRGIGFVAAIVLASSLIFLTGLHDAVKTPPVVAMTAIVAPTFEVAFSPKQGATELIIKNIKQAKKSILVAAYSFTSQPIAQELIDASKRGLDIKIVLDKSQGKDRYSMYSQFADANLPTRINYRYPIMHNKFMIIDDDTLQLGSFNYTKAAEQRNAENVMVIHDSPTVIKQYSQQWQKLWDEADPQPRDVNNVH